MARAIVGARVSVIKGDEKVSHLAQHETGVKWATNQGHEIVGTFQDLDVSAHDFDPWSRPDLGPWLTPERLGEWDVIVFSKVDRAFRSTRDSVRFAEWVQEHHKILAFAEDGLVLNYRDVKNRQSIETMMAEMFIYIGSFFAQIEWNRFQSRALDAHRVLKKLDRWPGGQPPYGYKIVPHPKGGKTLAVEKETAEAVKLMGDMYRSGKSEWEIADALTAKGVPPPSVYVAQNAGSDFKGRRKTALPEAWNQTTVGKILSSPATMGLKIIGSGKERRIARDETGLPIRLADPIFSEQEWAEIQEKRGVRSIKHQRSHGASPLLGVVYCGGCKRKLYRAVNVYKGSKLSYYRCVPQSGKPACKGHSFREELVHELLDDHMAQDMAAIPVVNKRYVPGEDHTRELEEVVKAMNDVREEKDMGLYDYEGGADEYKQRISALVAQRKALEALPHKPAEWLQEPTGEFYAEAYARMGTDERRALLLAADVRLYLAPNEFHLFVPEDLRARVQKFAPSQPA